MRKLRKRLAIFFALLSLLFACIAISNKLSTLSNINIQTKEISASWGREIESLARNQNKLIFFFSDKNAPQLLSKNAKKILTEHYITVNISPEKFPADFIILDAPLAKVSKKYNTLKAGILSPNLFPIYLTSEIRSDKKNTTLALDDAIVAAANQFEQNAYALKRTAKESTSFDAIPRDTFASIFGNSFAHLGFIHAESSRMFIYFNSNAPLTAAPAVLSENARLTARIAICDFAQFAAQNATNRATKILCARIKSNDESDFAKLLFLRALGEIPYTLTDNHIKTFYLQNVKKVAHTNHKNIREIALSTSVLLRAFSISKDEKFFYDAKNLANNLSNIALTEKILPSQTNKKSESSSLEYVLCARAFWDMSKFTNDQKWFERTQGIITRWNENFMTEFNLWSINSKKSALAKITRPIITRDSISPSYIGEAAQLFAEIDALYTSKNLTQIESSNELRREKIETRCAQNLKKLAVGASTISPLANPQWASLKLATFTHSNAQF